LGNLKLSPPESIDFRAGMLGLWVPSFKNVPQETRRPDQSRSA
jgi:hypothetical protein